MLAILRCGWLILLLWIMTGSAQAELAVPPLTLRVTDQVGLLTPSQQQNLETALHNFEARKGSQLAVLIVASTAAEPIESYSLRVSETWKLGRKGIDDGVLLLVARDDRAVRIETGYGLEGVIPDAVAKRVIAEIIVPYFKQGDYYGGIQAGVQRLIRIIDGEPLPPPQARDNAWSGMQDYLPVAFIAVVIGGGLLTALFGRLIGASLTGGITGVILWFLAGSTLIALIVAIVVFFLVVARGTQLGSSRHGGGFGGGSVGGGFRGGGGGFGGGGASGKW